MAIRETQPDADAFGDARWIRLAGCEHDKNLYLSFAKTFELSAPTEGWRLHITAASQYRVWLNGECLGQGPPVGCPALYYFDTFHVPAATLREGTNHLAVLLHHDGETTETIQEFEYGKPGLLAALEGPGGERVPTDASWKVRRAAEYSGADNPVSRWGGYKEMYHGERADAWRQPGYNASAWEIAEAFAAPEDGAFVKKLVATPVPPLEETWHAPTRIVGVSDNLGAASVDGVKQFPAPFAGQVARVLPGEPGACPSVTYDFGMLRVGYPKLSLAGGACIVELWYGETLDLLRLDVVRMPAGGGTWEAFQRRAFCYCRLVFVALEGAVEVADLAMRNVWYAYHEDTQLTTGDEQLDRMVSVSRHTLRANSSYHYEDCPMREQALWILDLRVMAVMNAYLYGNPELTAKCLRQSFAIQREDGSVASTGPRDNAMFHHDFMLHLVATLREHHDLTGDRALLEELYPAARKLDAFIRTYQADDGLLDSDLLERWAPYIDWSTEIEKCGKTTVLNALFVRHLDDLAALSRAVGEDDHADSLDAERARVAEKAHALFFVPEQGIYRDGVRHGQPLENISLQANLAALYAGIVPGDATDNLLARIWDSGEYPPPFGPSFYWLVYEALYRAGRVDAIEASMRSYWGAMLDRGATTWWEVFDPRTPAWAYPHPYLGNTPTYEMDWIPISACHGWSGMPGVAVPRYLLGIDLLQAGSGVVTVRPPAPARLQRADYAVPLAGGWLRLRFEKRGDTLAVEVEEEPPGVEICIQGAG